MKKNNYGLLEDTLPPGLTKKTDDVSWENDKIYK